ncbi:hypothetical protein [Odoribacter laneus]
MSKETLEALLMFLRTYYIDWKAGHRLTSQETNRVLRQFIKEGGNDTAFLYELQTGYECDDCSDEEVSPPRCPIIIDTETVMGEAFIMKDIVKNSIHSEIIPIKEQLILPEKKESTSPVMNIKEFCEFTGYPKNSIYQPEFRNNNNINELMIKAGKGTKYMFNRSKVYERYKK